MDTFFFDYLRGRGLGWIGFYVQHHSLSRKMNQIPPLIEYLFLFHTWWHRSDSCYPPCDQACHEWQKFT